MSTIDEQLQEIVRRIVETAHPLRIILFGSMARGEGRATSDVDVLAVVPEGVNRLHASQDIYRNLVGIGIGVDVVVATEDDLTKYKDAPGLVYREVLRDGRTLYAA